jgi:hypothetical protein
MVGLGRGRLSRSAQALASQDEVKGLLAGNPDQFGEFL